MKVFLNKGVLLISSLLVATFCGKDQYIIVPVLIVGVFFALNIVVRNEFIILFEIAILTILACFFDNFIFFLPIMFYELNFKSMFSIFAVGSLSCVFYNSNISYLAFFVMLALFSSVLNLSAKQLFLLETEHSSYVLDMQEKRQFLEEANKQLSEKQFYKIEAAKLKERNRIACDIHDNVGHLLARSILMTGAIMASVENENLKDNLNILKENLQNAMTNIRESVEGIHKDIFNLEKEIKKLVKVFTFCECKLKFSIDTFPTNEVAYAIVQIVKESLTNIQKHSNADFVEITINEHPAFYQVIVKDNGEVEKDISFSEHIGLKSMKERANELKGNFSIKIDNGVRIFASFPKEIIESENNNC